ncbi:AMP-binding protein [Pseudalkalibacillus hwajinpoensis]|uniref:AMP-binding protein n=1 Tax=Guptibacillus hwajinpoensis TaxID=208199 RepID=UPI00325BB0CA
MGFLKNPLVTTLAMFGIWKAGAIYCPINFNYTGRLLTYQLNDTEPALLITERRMLPIINEINQYVTIPSLIVHSPHEQDYDYNSEFSKYLFEYPAKEVPFDDLLHGNTENVMISVHYSDTANIIYTSGTTVPAKGVVQSYRWMNAYTHSFRLFNNQEDIVYNDLPLYHVGGAFAFVARASFVGCKVAVWDKFSPINFWKRIHLSGASNAILLDVMIPWLMKAVEKADDHKNPLNKVYMQPLPHYHHEVAKRFGFDFVFAGYGQTESGNGFVSIIEELGEGKGTPNSMFKGYTHNQIKEIAKDVNIILREGSTKLKKGHMSAPSPFMEACILNENDEESLREKLGNSLLKLNIHLLS